MFRNAIGKLSLRQKLLVLALAGVLLPLLVLTYLQYQSLAELRDKTKGAFKDNLRQGLTILQRQMKQRLEDVASQTLNPIKGLHFSLRSSPGSTEGIEKHSATVKGSHPEIEDISTFVYSDGKLYAYSYSDKSGNRAQAEFTEAQQRMLAAFEMALTTQSFVDDNRHYLIAYDSGSSPHHAKSGLSLLSDTDELRRSPGRRCGLAVTRSLSAIKSRFTNNLGAEHNGLYWGIKLGDNRQGAWKLDLWFLDAAGYEKHSKYCDDLRLRLTPETDRRSWKSKKRIGSGGNTGTRLPAT